MIRYSTDAEKDLSNISDYTQDHWEYAQADRYLGELVQCFEQIEKMPGLGRRCFAIHPSVLRIEQGQHVIFYLSRPDGVFICRVLHQRMFAESEDFLSSFSESIE